MTPGARSHLINYAPGSFTLFRNAPFRALFAPDHAMHLPLRAWHCGQLTADVRCEEVAMYCSDCHRPVHYSNPDNQGWCEACRRVIEISPCSVSYWYVAAAMVLPLFAIS
jgi:hypothetical protein